MTKREQIITALATVLSTITTANGYNSNIGKNVLIWQTAALNLDDLPAITIKDSSAEAQDGAIGSFRWRLKVESEIYCHGSTAAVDLRGMIQDVYSAIRTNYTLGGLAVSIDQPTDEIKLDRAETIIAAAAVTFIVTYDTQRWEI